jgi:hypothetical protein
MISWINFLKNYTIIKVTEKYLWKWHINNWQLCSSNIFWLNFERLWLQYAKVQIALVMQIESRKNWSPTFIFLKGHSKLTNANPYIYLHVKKFTWNISNVLLFNVIIMNWKNIIFLIGINDIYKFNIWKPTLQFYSNYPN